MTDFYFLANNTSYQMFGALLVTERHTVVFDGGLEEDADALYDLLKRLNRKRVDAWFFTHPHHDHIGAFMAFCRQYCDVLIEKLYLHFPDRMTLRLCPYHKAHNGIERTMWEDIWDLIEGPFAPRYQKIEVDDFFSFDDATVRVLRVMDPEFDLKTNFVNNSSAVLRIDTTGKSVLLLGDLGVQGGEQLMKQKSPEDFFADYTQMAHHGQKGVNRAFYEYIKPRRCLWPTPEKIWDNIGSDGPGSGKWDTAQTRLWMQEMGVTEHFVSKDGTVKIKLN